jgi:hypothetical protein
MNHLISLSTGSLQWRFFDLGRGVYQLKMFHFVAGLPLVLYIALEDISITINHLSQDFKQELEAENMRQEEKAISQQI